MNDQGNDRRRDDPESGLHRSAEQIVAEHMNMDDQVARVVEAGMKLRARFLRRGDALHRDHRSSRLWEQLGYSNTAHPWRNDRYLSLTLNRQAVVQRSLIWYANV